MTRGRGLGTGGEGMKILNSKWKLVLAGLSLGFALGGLGGGRALLPLAFAEPYFTRGVPAASTPLNGGEMLPADSGSSSGTVPEAVSSGQLAGVAGGLTGGWRNLLIGGDFGTNLWQRGVSLAGVGTSPTYLADRWAGWAASGETLSMAKTGTGVPSGLLAGLEATPGATPGQVCVGQVVESLDAGALAGKTGELSVWVAGGTGFSGSGVKLAVETGTGLDEGVAAMAAGAWAGQASTSASFGVSSTAARLLLDAAVPGGTKELGVEICYTPLSSPSSGDYMVISGVQLAQAVQAGQALLLERRPAAVEAQLQRRYTQSIVEGAAGVLVLSGGVVKLDGECHVGLPELGQMRVGPTLGLVLGGWKVDAGGTPVVLTGASLVGTDLALAATGLTPGQSCSLEGGTGGGLFIFSAEE